MDCEEKVDTYLNNYCSSGMTAASDPTTTHVPITPSLASRIDSTSTTSAADTISQYNPQTIKYGMLSLVQAIPTTVSCYTIRNTPTNSMEEQSAGTYDLDFDRILVITLGGLLGLSVILLCITCTCWMCTCRAKRKVSKMDRRPITYR